MIIRTKFLDFLIEAFKDIQKPKIVEFIGEA